MSGSGVLVKRNSIFARKKLLLRRPDGGSPINTGIAGKSAPLKNYFVENPAATSGDSPVLVINSSHNMAKEITMQLTLSMPGVSIMYAPTLELAAWILKKRPIQLVVSSPVLPDGSISRLTPVLSRLEKRPDLVVVGNMNVYSAEEFNRSGYEFAALKQMGQQTKIVQSSQCSAARQDKVTHIKEIVDADLIGGLGADIRNDLNNPLQEIVAMVFVAQTANSLAPATEEALNAIDKAANNMASYVKDLEGKIREVVG